jgi:pyruvate/2-oxoglutarate dehydrogenase complex dihydrolipoamide acyltransferase (E2) component
MPWTPESAPHKRSIFDIQRRVVANKTYEGWHKAPHASLCANLDVTGLLDLIEALRKTKEYEERRITLNSVLLKVIAEGLKCAPEMNAHIEYYPRTSVGFITTFEDINVAVPFRSEDGRMITPVVENVGRKSLAEVCDAMEDLKRRALNSNVDALLLEAALHDSFKRLFRGDLRIFIRLWANFISSTRLPKVSKEKRRAFAALPDTERITPENLISATALVSNMGSVVRGVDMSFNLLEIIQPQTIAIGLGAMTRKPVVVESASGQEEVQIRNILPLTLCFDHRAMDLEHVRPFIDKINTLCKNPALLLEA